MRDFGELIDAFGAVPLAKILGLPDTHVRTMKTRGSIPPEYWPAIINAAPTAGIRGLNLALMMKLRSAKFPQHQGDAA